VAYNTCYKFIAHGTNTAVLLSESLEFTGF